MSWREELAWAAGLFDGEGSAFSSAKASTHVGLCLCVGQRDRYVLDRLRNALGFGVVYGPGPRGMFRFAVGSLEQVQAAVAMLWTWLSPMKRTQASKALERAASVRATQEARREFCKHGHRFTAENTRVYEWHGKRSRFCRECGRERWRAKRAGRTWP